MKTGMKRFSSVFACLLFLSSLVGANTAVLAAASVTVVGSLQSEIGCAGDWDPACAASHLTYDAGDDVWQGAWTVPAGSWEYKVALDGGWAENYGMNGVPGGANIPLNLAASGSVKFYFDEKTHWITDNQTAVIATVPGSFQSELGCGSDWDPSCLRSWLQDLDGDGIYTFSTGALPAGSYEGKVTINESWDENYGQGGVPGGANISFNVPVDFTPVDFSYDAATHILGIAVGSGTTVALVGSLQSELGCAGDWDPACAATNLDYVADDDVYQRVFSVPAGSWEYKAALNGGWDENYGLHGQPGGANISLNLASGTSVKFYYDPKTHWITDNHTTVIATAPGSFQSELGCGSDWDPSCLRSWLQDLDGDGIYTFSTGALPAGAYEAKAAVNESWDENYGQGGVPGGANIPFSVPAGGALVTFSYNATSHLLTISVAGGSGSDNNVQWDGLRHDSRDLLYRTPGGAVPAGSQVLVRFRTFHNDVTAVQLRVYDFNAAGQRLIPMELAASDVSCYQAGLEAASCDFWQAALQESAPNNLWYRFIVVDGSKTVYYADNTAALDGGLGSPSDNMLDQSYALMFFDPAFEAPEWVMGASMYQIFPDRFRDGRSNNNPKTGDTRYDDPVLKLPWNTLPEGYCRNYSDAGTNCPWRYDTTPPDWSPLVEGPRGRDYFGGDLRGVDQYLDYLQALGVNTLYFNPIFDGGSNHGYDTQNYYAIDPYFGTQKDWKNLVKHAEERGMRIVLDGVFNHLSSDSAFFDRYHHYAAVGACESLNSPFRSWFYFHDVPAGTGPCVGSSGQPNSASYDGWFGFDSIPVINKNLPEVQQYFLTAPNSVSRYWLKEGSSGWRMDVMGDASFPNGYWETFRAAVKETRADALIISETWQKDSTLLRMLRGDRADTTMNYRLRDAVVGFLATQGFDSKGFADSGRVIQPSEFAARMESIREDYPDAAYYSLMNLLDSHDTERIRWTLTPGMETMASKEANAAEGKQRQRIASLIQFTVPGIPTVYYGDEVGVTGDDDPDDRRTYPWADKGGSPDTAMLSHYTALNALRSGAEALVSGDFTMLLADDDAQVIAYGRKTGSQAAVVIVNRGSQPASGAIPVAGYLPDGLVLIQAYAVGTGGGSVVVANGAIQGTIGPLSAVVLLSGPADLTPPDAPTNLMVTGEGNGSASLTWIPVPGAAAYNLYCSPLSGGGWVKVNPAPLTSTSFDDSGLINARTYYYAATALDAAGNESAFSNEASALPHLSIGWANLQWPPSMSTTLNVVIRTPNAYGQVWIEGATQLTGPTETLRAQLGYGPDGSDPALEAGWTWVDASFNVDAGNNDEFMASLLPEAAGEYDYAFRYTTTNGRDWLYADLDGTGNGYQADQAGALTVNSSGDTTLPAAPQNLRVTSASPAGVSLAWDRVMGDASLYGYEVLRGEQSGGPYTLLARLTGNEYTDLTVMEGASYYYVVRSLDLSFNRSGYSSEVAATAALRTVTVTFTVEVPATTDATGLSVFVAGSLSRLDGGLPDWNPGGVVLTRLDATHWQIVLTGLESTQIEYKYTLGSWDFVEKGASCDEIGNRMLSLSYGANGSQQVNDTVLNWRNVAPCGN